jgi:integrase
MTNEIISANDNDNRALSTDDSERLQQAGQAANYAASRFVFDEYRKDLTTNTTRAHDNDLDVFALFLQQTTGIKATGQAFTENPATWQHITHGLVKAFQGWNLKQGYAIQTINRRVSTVRKYAGLAHEAGILDESTIALINTVKAFNGKRARNRDENRTEAGIPTRVIKPLTKDNEPVLDNDDKPILKPAKKSENVRIPDSVVELLKTDHDNTPQGVRDRLLLCLLLDHAMRASEAANMTVGNVNMEAGTIRFYRIKTDTWQTDNMTADTYKAMKAYLEYMPLMANEKLIRRSVRGQNLGKPGISSRTVSRIVTEHGKRHGIKGLSAHDCRHSWATRARDAETPLMDIMSGGGWKTPMMVKRYTDERDIANEAVKLSS